MTVRRGFTLLELLLATVVSVMLMMGVLAVMTNLATGQETVARRRPGSTVLLTRAIDEWVKLLRGDLIHAIRIDAAGRNHLTIIGSGALDGRGRTRTHRPVRVSYSLETVDGEPWLVRRQALEDVLSNENIQRDLVCSGVTRFELVAQGAVPTVSAADSPPTPRSETGDSPSDAATGAGPDAKSESGAGDSDSVEPDEPSQPPKTSFKTKVSDDGEVSIMVNGVHFYPRYAPRWAREKYYRETATTPPHPAPDETVSGDEPGSGGKAEDGEKGHADRDVAASSASSVGFTWRLRVWTDDSRQPAYDRIVTVQLSGGS